MLTRRSTWLIILLIPIIVLALNEWMSVRATESALKESVERQANTILFSVNQSSWDLAGSWMDAWARRAVSNASGDTSGNGAHVSSNPTVALWWALPTNSDPIQLGTQPPGTPILKWDSLLARQPISPESLVALFRQDYRKLEPIVGLPSGYQGLWTMHPDPTGGFMPVGFIFPPGTFVANQVAPMLQAASGGSLSLGVFQGPNDSLLTATVDFVPSPDDPRNALWLFPDTWLVLDLQDDQYNRLTQGRLRRSAALLLLAFAILGIGLLLIYRSVDRQSKLARMKTDFVANVSHELRTPLSLIRMFAETLEMGRVPTDEKKQEYYRIIGSESERLGYLINNILDFSKMEAGKKVYHKSDVSINEVVQSVLETYRYTLDSRGFSWRSNLDPSNPVVHADRDAIAEVLINLIENAVKASTEQKSIILATSADGDQVQQLPKGTLMNLAGFWKFKRGDNLLWMQPALNDDDWYDHKIPLGWDDNGLRDYDGFGWYRYHFVAPQSWSGEDLALELGRIDDVDEVYLYGGLLGPYTVIRRASDVSAREWQESQPPAPIYTPQGQTESWWQRWFRW